MSVPTANDGVAVYTYIKAAAEIIVGVSAMRANGSGSASGYGACVVATAASADMLFVGVAQAIIASGSYGFVLTKGVGTVKVTTTSAAGDALIMEGTAGNLDDAAVTVARQLGCVTGTSISGGATGEAYVDFPG
tara:strand:+ start:1911 stop:2312 length:402 start_codon:yes stop_codon:yes gene_type:complete